MNAVATSLVATIFYLIASFVLYFKKFGFPQKNESLNDWMKDKNINSTEIPLAEINKNLKEE